MGGCGCVGVWVGVCRCVWRGVCGGVCVEECVEGCVEGQCPARYARIVKLLSQKNGRQRTMHVTSYKTSVSHPRVRNKGSARTNRDKKYKHSTRMTK